MGAADSQDRVEGNGEIGVRNNSKGVTLGSQEDSGIANRGRENRVRMEWEGSQGAGILPCWSERWKAHGRNTKGFSTLEMLQQCSYSTSV